MSLEHRLAKQIIALVYICGVLMIGGFLVWIMMVNNL
jgi:hypothetical protein